VRTEAVLDDIPDTAPPPTYDPELVAQLPALLDEIPPRSRMVLLLHYHHELTLAEVADILGIPLGTAKSRLAYGLDKLRTRLQHESLPAP
jgi:RNA polymerase sigma-70 factor (ECF subfamily)